MRSLTLAIVLALMASATMTWAKPATDDSTSTSGNVKKSDSKKSKKSKKQKAPTLTPASVSSETKADSVKSELNSAADYATGLTPLKVQQDQTKKIKNIMKKNLSRGADF